jgi:hypothetical protein
MGDLLVVMARWLVEMSVVLTEKFLVAKKEKYLDD